MGSGKIAYTHVMLNEARRFTKCLAIEGWYRGDDEIADTGEKQTPVGVHVRCVAFPESRWLAGVIWVHGGFNQQAANGQRAGVNSDVTPRSVGSHPHATTTMH